MSPLLAAWLQFGAALVLIGVAGTTLSRCGDVIADRTGLGGTWVGVILIATVTSFPELITGVSAVTLADDPDIAVGTVLGSCVFNMLILVILDYLTRGRSVFEIAGPDHGLAAGWSILLIGIVGFSLVLAQADGGTAPALSFVGIYTPILLLLYLNAVRVVFRHEVAKRGAGEEVEQERAESLQGAVVGYLVAASVVVAVSLYLPFVARDLADVMGWHRTFVGTLFVAAVTSLPEVVVTVAALRIGAVDMAVANLFGSNLFNIMVVAVDDLFFVKGPILSHVSQVHVMSAFSAMMMTGVAIAGLLYRPRGGFLGMATWASLILATIYLLNSYVLYLYGG